MFLLFFYWLIYFSDLVVIVVIGIGFLFFLNITQHVYGKPTLC